MSRVRENRTHGSTGGRWKRHDDQGRRQPPSGNPETNLGPSTIDYIVTAPAPYPTSITAIIARPQGLTAQASPTSFPRSIVKGHDAAPPEIEAAFKKDLNALRRQHVSAGSTVAHERALKAMEPAISAFARRGDPESIRRLLHEHRSWLVSHRTGTVPEIGGVIEQELAMGRLRLIRGSVAAARAHGDQLLVRAASPPKPDETIAADHVILALGRETDYAATSDRMWRSLLHRGLCEPEPITRAGLHVDATGKFVARNRSERLRVVGPARQGDELVRNGRLGAFVFSIGTIRNQALQAAVGVMQDLDREEEGRDREVLNDFIAAANLATNAAVAKLLSDRLVRMTATRIGYPGATLHQTKSPTRQEEIATASSSLLTALGPAVDAQRLATLVVEERERLATTQLCDLSWLATDPYTSTEDMEP